ncbi:hypothetical protein WG906_09085 [Pedobacter sp. P351]|uniref:hypothetical protein n=1 Tax=Pedobacter superstes TaxID=3133441 RepID=UPI00309D5EB7
MMKKIKALPVRVEQEDGRLIECPKTEADKTTDLSETTVIAKKKPETASESSTQWFKQIYPKPRNFPLLN